MIHSPLALPILVGTGLYAAWSDARYRRLSNPLVALTAICGIALTVTAGGLAAASSNLLHSAIAMLIGLPLFARGLIGGGDVKYYAAVATWFPLDQGFRLLAFVSLAGMVLAAGWLIGQRAGLRPHRAGPDLKASAHAEKVPFGIAIASGAILAALAWPQ